MRTEAETKNLASVMALWTLKNIDRFVLYKIMSTPEERTEFLETVCKCVVDGGLQVDMDIFRATFCETLDNNLKR